MRNIIASFLLIVIPKLTFAELQRLAIVPQGKVVISTGAEGSLKAMCIDYFRDAPSLKTSPYTQLYNAGEIKVKINGEAYSGEIEKLLEGQNPILILKPVSADEVRVIINKENEEGLKIKEIEIEVSSAAYIGNIPEDRDVKKAEIIYKNYGYEISQNEFWRRAKILDILEASNLLSFDASQILSLASKELVDKLYGNYVLSYPSQKGFKDLVNAAFIRVNREGSATDETDRFMSNLITYAFGLQNAYECKDAPLDEREKILKRLRIIKPSDNTLTDTIIKGVRHILVVAWKTRSFIEERIKEKQFRLPYYPSVDQFFTFPLFVTVAPDLQNWYLEKRGQLLNTDQLKLRLKQLLGLPPNATNDYIIEFWVQPEDLFRPSKDSSISSLTIRNNLSESYLSKLNQFFDRSYIESDPVNCYPFAGLGFTYDWSPENPSHVGLSEFVLRENKKAYLRRYMLTIEYFKGIKR